MSKSAIDEASWAELSPALKADAVREGRATLKQMTAGLLDGPDILRNACCEFLLHTDASFEDLPLSDAASSSPQPPNNVHKLDRLSSTARRTTRRGTKRTTLRPKFGLPEGFSRQRFGRNRLLEQNIYRLPNGQEFIPSFPTGILGRRHLYALLTSEQYLEAKRGSVYIRTDGRIFDYSVDCGDVSADLFDTGYTIYDLERTGRYAPDHRDETKEQEVMFKRAAQGS